MKNQMNSHILLEVVGLGYVAYVIVDSIRSKLNGSMELSTPVFVLLMVVMIAAEAILAVLVYRTWRKSRSKPEEDAPPEETPQTAGEPEAGDEPEPEAESDGEAEE